MSTPPFPRSFLESLTPKTAQASLIKLIGIGISFLFAVGLAQLLETESFGVFASGLSLSLILGAVGSCGQHTMVIRFWPSLDEAYGRDAAIHAIQRSLMISGLGCIALTSAGAIMTNAGFQIDSFGASAEIWLAIGSLSSAVTLSEVTSGVLRAQGFIFRAFAPRDILWRSIALGFLSANFLPLSPVLALSVTAGVLWMLTAAQLTLLVWRSPGILRLRNCAVLPADECRAMRYAQWGFWGNAVLSPLQQQGGTVVVAVTLGPLEAGAFFAASRLANLLAIVQTGANQISAPMMARSWRAGKQDELKIISDTTALLGTLTSVFGFAGFVALGGWLLAIFDAEYRQAYAALLVLGAAQVIATYCGPNALLLLMTGHEAKVLAIKAFVAFASLGLTYLLADKMLILGAAIGAAMGILVQNILGVMLSRRHTGIAPMTSVQELCAAFVRMHGGRTRKELDATAKEATYTPEPSLQPVLVFGYPRSGTTLLGSIIGSSDRCVVIPEAQFMTEGLIRFGKTQHPTREMLDYILVHYRFRIWEFTPSREWTSGLPTTMTYPDLLDRLFRHYATDRPDADFVVEHDPKKRKFLDILHQTYPDALLLHIIRDGRAIAASTMKLTWGHQDIIRLAQEWKHSVRQTERWLETHRGTVRSFTIRYEDLLEDSEAIVNDLLAELGLALNPEEGVRTDGLRVVSYTRDQHALIGGGVEKSRADAWKRDLTAREVEIFEVFAGDLLSSLGYERQFEKPQPPGTIEKLRLLFKGAVRRGWNKPQHILRRRRLGRGSK